VELIAFITDMHPNGENPTQYLDDKIKEKALIERVHDLATKDFEEVENQRGRITNKLADIK